MGALAAYFDDSFAERIYVLSGYLSTVETWDMTFAPAWAEILSAAPHPISEFKTSDCRQGTGEFRGWSRAERDKLTIELIDVITDKCPPEEIIGVSSVVVFPGSARKEHRRFVEQVGFSFCLHSVMQRICRGGTPTLIGDEDLQLVLDDKPTFVSLATEHFTAVRDSLGTRMAARVPATPIFSDSKRLTPLQAADLLAYETYKETKSRLDGGKREVSKALRRLVDKRVHYAMCIGWEKLREASRRFHAEGRPLTGIHESVLYSSGTTWRGSDHWPHTE